MGTVAANAAVAVAVAVPTAEDDQALGTEAQAQVETVARSRW